MTTSDTSVAQREPGGSEDTPLRIYSPLKLTSNEPIWITSPFHVALNEVLINVRKPIEVLCPSGVRIATTEPLGKGFADGWGKCPDEIKTHILVCNLTLNEAVTRDLQEDALQKYLRMTPEIAGLANETFYKSNTFKVDVRNYAWYGPPPLPHMSICWHPPAMFGHHIQKIELCLELATYQWYHVGRLAQGQYGLSNLKHVKISVNDDLVTPNGLQTFKAAVGVTVVSFQCEGFIHLFHPIRTRLQMPPMHGDLTFLDFLRSIVKFRQTCSDNFRHPREL